MEFITTDDGKRKLIVNNDITELKGIKILVKLLVNINACVVMLQI